MVLPYLGMVGRVTTGKDNLEKVWNQISFFLKPVKGRELADKVRKGWEMGKKSLENVGNFMLSKMWKIYN